MSSESLNNLFLLRKHGIHISSPNPAASMIGMRNKYINFIHLLPPSIIYPCQEKINIKIKKIQKNDLLDFSFIIYTCLLAYSENLWLHRERQSFSGQLANSFLHISQNLITDISKEMVSHSCRCTANCSNCSVFIFFIWYMIFSFILSRLVIFCSYVFIYFYFVISKIFIYCFIQNRKVK